MITTLVITSLIIIASLFTYFNGSSKTKDFTFLILVFSSFAFLGAFRSSSVGNDTSAYSVLFSEVAGITDTSLLMERYEPGYLYLNKILSAISPNPQILLIFTSVISMLGFALFIYKYSNMVWMSTLLFFLLRYFSLSVNSIRHTFAILICLLAYHLFNKKQHTWFIISVLCASTFHITALSFLIIWPASYFRLKKTSLLFVAIVTVGILIYFDEFFSLLLTAFSRFAYYLGSDYLNMNTRLATIANLIIFSAILALGFLVGYHKKDNSPHSYVMPNNIHQIPDGFLTTNILLIGVVISAISLKFNLLDRAAAYFTVFSIIYLPNSLHYIKDKTYSRLAILIVVLLFTSYDCVIEYYRPDWNRVYPYNFYWGSLF